jgi:hypothetical protein
MRVQLPFTLLVAAVLACSMHAAPAQAQRVFVSGTGSDSNPCTFALPCRSFQHAHDVAPANGEIDVLDPAGYGPLTIKHGISIQAHGFGGITETSGSADAITINAGTSDAITLNGLLLDGAGTGGVGIFVEAGGSLQILNCVIRHFGDGIFVETSTKSANLLIENTIASDNANSGIDIETINTGTLDATISRTTANNNAYGVMAFLQGTMMIKDSVLANNSNSGLFNETNPGIVTWLARSAISGNSTGVNIILGTVNSYRDNYINGNTTDISGTLGSASTR